MYAWSSISQSKCCWGDGTITYSQPGEVCSTVGSGETRKLLDSIFFDGDKLTEERARNSQLIFKDGDNDVDRLEGLQPVHADWHAKVNLYQVMSIKTPPDPSLLSTCCFLFGSQHQNMDLRNRLRNRLAVEVFILPLFN